MSKIVSSFIRILISVVALWILITIVGLTFASITVTEAIFSGLKLSVTLHLILVCFLIFIAGLSDLIEDLL